MGRRQSTPVLSILQVIYHSTSSATFNCLTWQCWWGKEVLLKILKWFLQGMPHCQVGTFLWYDCFTQRFLLFHLSVHSSKTVQMIEQNVCLHTQVTAVDSFKSDNQTEAQVLQVSWDVALYSEIWLQSLQIFAVTQLTEYLWRAKQKQMMLDTHWRSDHSKVLKCENLMYMYITFTVLWIVVKLLLYWLFVFRATF